MAYPFPDQPPPPVAAFTSPIRLLPVVSMSLGPCEPGRTSRNRIATYSSRISQSPNFASMSNLPRSLGRVGGRAHQRPSKPAESLHELGRFAGRAHQHVHDPHHERDGEHFPGTYLHRMPAPPIGRIGSGLSCTSSITSPMASATPSPASSRSKFSSSPVPGASLSASTAKIDRELISSTSVTMPPNAAAARAAPRPAVVSSPSTKKKPMIAEPPFMKLNGLSVLSRFARGLNASTTMHSRNSPITGFRSPEPLPDDLPLPPGNPSSSDPSPAPVATSEARPLTGRTLRNGRLWTGVTSMTFPAPARAAARGATARAPAATTGAVTTCPY